MLIQTSLIITYLRIEEILIKSQNLLSSKNIKSSNINKPSGQVRTARRKPPIYANFVTDILIEQH